MFLSFKRKHRSGIWNRSLIQLAALLSISPASPESLYETRSVMGKASPALYVGHSGEWWLLSSLCAFSTAVILWSHAAKICKIIHYASYLVPEKVIVRLFRPQIGWRKDAGKRGGDLFLIFKFPKNFFERPVCCVYLSHTDICVLFSISSVLSRAATIHQLLVNCWNDC